MANKHLTYLSRTPFFSACFVIVITLPHRRRRHRPRRTSSSSPSDRLPGQQTLFVDQSAPSQLPSNSCAAQPPFHQPSSSFLPFQALFYLTIRQPRHRRRRRQLPRHRHRHRQTQRRCLRPTLLLQVNLSGPEQLPCRPALPWPFSFNFVRQLQSLLIGLGLLLGPSWALVLLGRSLAASGAASRQQKQSKRCQNNRQQSSANS